MNNYKKITLKNGITLYFYKDENMCNIYFDFMIFYGSDGKWFNFNYDGKDYHVLPGVAHFLEHMLGEHSKYGNIYTNFAKRKYWKNGGTALDATHYFFKGNRDIKQSIKELIEAIEEPVFTKEDVIETSKAIAEESRMGQDNIYRLAYSLINRNSYTNYDKYHETLSAIGNPETTKELDYDTLKLCYDAFYYDENKAIILAGNLDEKEAVDYIESIYENIPRHEKKVKELKIDRTGIRKEKDTLEFDVKENIYYLAYKTKLPKNFTLKEIVYYQDIYNHFNFSRNSKFQIDNFEKCLLNSIVTCGSSEEEDCILFYIGVTTDKIEEYKKAHEENLNTIIDENLFNIAIKSEIADEARKYDDKYRIFSNYFLYHEYTDNFSDIDFIKTLTYERFKEYVNSLNYTEKTFLEIKKKETN